MQVRKVNIVRPSPVTPNRRGALTRVAHLQERWSNGHQSPSVRSTCLVPALIGARRKRPNLATFMPNANQISKPFLLSSTERHTLKSTLDLPWILTPPLKKQTLSSRTSRTGCLYKHRIEEGRQCFAPKWFVSIKKDGKTRQRPS